MGYVYLLLEVDKDGYERHKIGISKNHPSQRQKQLQTGNSNNITVLNYYKTTNYKKVEQWLHNKYANLKTEANNEWFTLNDTDVSSFLVNCLNADETINYLLANNSLYK